MNILITGSNGMVGQNFYKNLDKNKFQVYLTSRSKCNINLANYFFQSDFENNNTFKNLKNFVNPDIIIHCAAMTNVDLCETDKSRAFKINVESTKSLLDTYYDKKIIYISSDAVFGSKDNNDLIDTPNPDNYYGLTKLKSEKIILQNSNNVVVRTTPIGFNYINNSGFLNWALSSLILKKSIKLFDDVYFNPIHTSLLLKYILLVIQINLKGVIHINSNFKYTKYKFIKLLASFLKIDSSHVLNSKLSKANLVAKRNKNQILKLEKSENLLRIKYPDVNENFLIILNELKNNTKLKNFLIKN